MLYSLLYPLHESFGVFNVFKYITFRSFGAMMTAMILSLLLGAPFIRWLRAKAIGQSIRELGPESHYSKKGTPTMGGGLILGSILVSTLLWSDLKNHYVWISLFVLIGTGIIGWIDDYKKVVMKNSKGLSAKQKLVFQTLVALIASFLLYQFRDSPPVLKFPFFKDLSLDLGLFYIPFSTLVIVGASNAVNLTDGLDGLAVGPTITTSITFAVLAYCAGNFVIAEYLQIPFVSGAGELAIFLASTGAACLGFLWFNAYPAEVFMGDVGALALGGALGVAAVITKNELLLVICGGIFVLEAVSVMMQVASFKLTGKRIFKMAPLHHHFEKKGWHESKVTVRFWIISIMLALATLATLKLR
ncbi:MAG: phospho-N-acetylmuramoyl-pentapeptide-transferase [Bdellovibrionales bacterium]|nr:phospho-N-acetylmuramoyl-pentapeptide-transferase [Bdellovibrionales bacterium]